MFNALMNLFVRARKRLLKCSGLRGKRKAGFSPSLFFLRTELLLFTQINVLMTQSGDSFEFVHVLFRVL